MVGIGLSPSGTGDNVQILGNVSASKFIGDGSQLTGISGGGGGISMSGTTSNGVLTFNTSTQASVESGLTFNGTDLELRAGSGAKVEFLGPAGGGNNGITYMDTGTGQRYGLLFEGSNQVALCNRAASGVVDIRANTSTEGSTGESTIIEVNNTHVDMTKGLRIDNSTGTNWYNNAILTSNDSDLYLRRDFDDTAPTQIIMTSTTMDFWTNSTAKKFMMESDGDFHADGDVLAESTSVSDRRLKTNLVEITPKESLEKLLSLQGYEFEWKHKEDGVHYGLIAQDIEKVLPHAITEKKVPFYDGTALGNQPSKYKKEWLKEQGIEDDKYKTARYSEIIPVIIEGMKELQKQIDELKLNSHEPQNYKQECERMQKELNKLKQEVEELKNGYKNR